MSSGQLILFPAPPASREPDDAPARRAALDPERSVLVQAPAGAGKTNLLTERFLALLARVEAPEPIGQLARAALAHAEALGWALLEQPHRLQVETIDSLCLRLAHGQPLLARLGGALAPAEISAGIDPPDPEVLFQFEPAAITDGRLAK